MPEALVSSAGGISLLVPEALVSSAGGTVLCCRRRCSLLPEALVSVAGGISLCCQRARRARKGLREARRGALLPPPFPPTPLKGGALPAASVPTHRLDCPGIRHTLRIVMDPRDPSWDPWVAWILGLLKSNPGQKVSWKGMENSCFHAFSGF